MAHMDSADETKIVRSGTWYMELNEEGHLKSFHISDAVRHMLGYETKEEFPDTPECLFDHVHPDDFPIMYDAAVVAAHGTQDTYDVEYRLRKKSGEYLPVNATGDLIRTPEGKPYMMHGSIIDLSDYFENRKNHKFEEVLQLKRRLVDALSTEYDMLLYINPYEHRITLIENNVMTAGHDRLTRIFDGQVYEESVKAYIEGFVAPGDQERITRETSLDYLLSHIEEGKNFQLRYTLIKTAGTRHDLMLTYAHLRDTEGKVHFACGFQTIDAVMQEERRKQAELKAGREAADAANKAKSTFLFNMSHDIRTPMNAIIGFTNLLAEHLDDKAKALDYIQKIQGSNEFLLSLINNVLEMARIESGEETVEESPARLDVLLQEAWAVFEGQMAKKGLNFKYSLQIQHNEVFLDITKVREITLNLVSNAYKYTPAGGTVSLELNELPSDRPEYANFRLTISDTGIGMPKEFLPNLFDAFTREKSTTQSGILGTGLGMHIVHELVRLMNGTIEVTSEIGKGTTFVVTLPHRIASDIVHVDTVSEHAVKDESRFNGKRVLLAEDNELNAEIVIMLLKDRGFEVDHAEDGVICVDMLDKAASGYYDLILMDIQMPNMDGYQATREIRAHSDPVKANIPIAAMTANAFKEDIEKAMKVGMNAHIAKPIDVEKMMETIADMLE